MNREYLIKKKRGEGRSLRGKYCTKWNPFPGMTLHFNYSNVFKVQCDQIRCSANVTAAVNLLKQQCTKIRKGVNKLKPWIKVFFMTFNVLIKVKKKATFKRFHNHYCFESLSPKSPSCLDTEYWQILFTDWS